LHACVVCRDVAPTGARGRRYFNYRHILGLYGFMLLLDTRHSDAAIDVSLVPAVCAPMTKRLLRYFFLALLPIQNMILERMGAAQALLSIVQFG